MADPVTGELYNERFNFGQAAVEQPEAEVAHLEAVLLDFTVELARTVLWDGPDGRGEDFDRGWNEACEAVQERLSKRLAMVLASRGNLARHGQGGAAAGQISRFAPGGGPGTASIGDGRCRSGEGS